MPASWVRHRQFQVQTDELDCCYIFSAAVSIRSDILTMISSDLLFDRAWEYVVYRRLSWPNIHRRQGLSEGLSCRIRLSSAHSSNKTNVLHLRQTCRLQHSGTLRYFCAVASRHMQPLTCEWHYLSRTFTFCSYSAPTLRAIQTPKWWGGVGCRCCVAHLSVCCLPSPCLR